MTILIFNASLIYKREYVLQVNSILITGSAGFIGTHLAEHYLKLGFAVIGFDNYITGTQENTHYLSRNYPKNFQFFNHDVCVEWPIVKVRNLKHVFHFASPASVQSYQKFPIETLFTNSVGLQNAIKFADRHQARLIFASTSEVYGSSPTSPQKENDWGYVNSFGFRSCYNESKRFGEALIFSSNEQNATQHGLVRIFNTYGSRMHPEDDRVLNTFVKKALKNEDLVLYGDGSHTRSFCYVDDLVNGIFSYANSQLTQPVNLGNDQELSIKELAEIILEMTQSKSKIVSAAIPADEPPHRKPDLTFARKALAYSPKYDLESGLQRLIKEIYN